MRYVFLYVVIFLLELLGNSGKTLAQEEFVIISDTTLQQKDSETEIPEEINVSRFMIGKTEVTQSQFKKIMGYNPSFYAGNNKPVETLSWWEAIQYCNKRSIKECLETCYDLSTGKCDFSKNGYRLPTNTEWSIASCYADIKVDYKELIKRGNFGINNVEDIKLLDDELQSGTCPVAQYEQNKFGLYDVLGNVWEWCYDYYDDSHTSTPASLNNPTGNYWGIERIIRGGSFVSPGISWGKTEMCSSMRPEYSSRFTGFRVVRNVKPKNIQKKMEDSSKWFSQFNQVPKGYSNNPGSLRSLCQKENGVSINSLSEWDKKKEKINKKWKDLLGELSIDTPEVNVKVIRTYDEDIYWGKLMYLQVEPGFWEKIYLMIPKKPIHSPIPVVITPYYDVDFPAGKNMGGRISYSPMSVKDFAYIAVQHGYIALAVKWFGESYGENYTEAVANLHIRHPKCSGLGKWVWDAHRVVDYLYTLPNVDKNNIGIIGHSLGGKMALYAAAMDERISVAVASELGIGFKFSNYEDYWYFGKYIRDIQDGTDQHELLGLMAPRPFLLIGGDKYDTEKSWYYINAGREVYSLYDKKENIGFFNHHSGHQPSPQAVNLGFKWLDHYLNNPKHEDKK